LKPWSAALLALLLGTGCVAGFSMGIDPIPLPPREAPVPKPFRGEAAPELIESGVEGILRAPDVDPLLYYVESEQLWYRYWRRRWYQAFYWDGYWFPPEQLPAAFEGGPPGVPEAELPRLPELEDLEDPEERPADPR